MVLCILDGWGYRHDDAHNAIRAADTPVMDALWHAYWPVAAQIAPETPRRDT